LWPITGLSTEALGEATATHEALRIVRRDPGVVRLIFARPAWPGYRAKFNGVEIPVIPYGSFLVAVELPNDGSTGTLVITLSRPFANLTFLLQLFLALYWFWVPFLGAPSITTTLYLAASSGRCWMGES
jgi:hypothetical protein